MVELVAPCICIYQIRSRARREEKKLPIVGGCGGGGGGGASRFIWWCLFHGTERYGTERNAGLFHGTDKCDHGTINLILEFRSWLSEILESDWSIAGHYFPYLPSSHILPTILT